LSVVTQKQDDEMRQVLSFHLDSYDVNPVLYYDEPTLCYDDDDVSVFILIHIDADNDGIPLRMTMLRVVPEFMFQGCKTYRQGIRK
jgi:uncharacterized protein YprB with RNaseH-like and TPR domain